MRQAIRRFLVGEDGEAGSALIEFTICVPLLVAMSMYTIDFGWYFWRQMEVQNAAQAGVDWTIVNHSVNAAGINAAVSAATTYVDITLPTPISLPNQTPAPTNENPAEWCGCPAIDASGNPFVNYTANTAPNPCPPCGTAVGEYSMSSSRRRPYGIHSINTACSPAPPVPLPLQRRPVSNDIKTTTQ